MKGKRAPKRRQPRKPKQRRDPQPRRPGESDEEFARRMAEAAWVEWEDMT